jgi:hypothetical protein
MAVNHFFQLKSIKSGPVAGDGGMGTVLTEKFGETVLGSASFSGEDTTTTNFNIEEHDDAIESISIAGSLILNFSTHNASPAALLAAFGGTVVGGIWHAPASEIEIEQSIEIEMKTGLKLQITRIKLKARPNFTFAKDSIGQIDFTGTVLAPTKVGESKYRVIQPA